jgi:quercetin dioxygenase-like cupin family protein
MGHDAGQHPTGDRDGATVQGPPRRGIKLFRGHDAIPIAASGAMSPPQFNADDMKALAADGPRPPTVAMGIDDKLVFQGEGPEGSSLVRAWLGPHYVLPRHSHSGDCLYYIVQGSITMGAQVLGAGDGFFVPSNAPYAYEAGADGAVVLEFRTQTSFDMQIPGGQLERWRKMATVAEEHGERWVELRAEATV